MKSFKPIALIKLCQIVPPKLWTGLLRMFARFHGYYHRGIFLDLSSDPHVFFFFFAGLRKSRTKKVLVRPTFFLQATCRKDVSLTTVSIMTHHSHSSIFDVGLSHTIIFWSFQVEWFMHQKEKKYKLFSTSFKDPMLSDQWYIVSCCLQMLFTYVFIFCYLHIYLHYT